MNPTDKKKIIEIKDYVNYLSLLAIEKAKSGHPGLPLGCSLLGTTIYHSFLRFNPNNPRWQSRDRFILSAGHGSMLLYALNYVFMKSFTLKDLSNFRQLKSKTPGHPEYDLDRGIETTTGPLGQGFANAVGVAIKAKIKPNLSGHLSGHGQAKPYAPKVYTLLGDGCLMEGITGEAASLAGNLGLDNLIAIYDDNSVTIDGKTDIALSEDVSARFKSLAWEVYHCRGNDIDEIEKTLSAASDDKSNDKGSKTTTKKPKLIILKTNIGEGLNELQGNPKAHGNKAGLEEIAYFVENSTLGNYFKKHNYPIKPTLEKQIKTGKFLALEDLNLSNFIEKVISRKEKHYQNWKKKFSIESHEKKLKENHQKVSKDFKKVVSNFKTEKTPNATRNISSEVLQLFAAEYTNLIGGSADLVASTKATIKKSHYLSKTDFSGRNIAYGVREHAMAAINNGLALGGEIIPFSSTFLSFLDYLKPALRLAAISKLKHLFIFSHDSIHVGEDGPTHQPIEHINSLRLIPDHYTFRPANDIEMAFSFLFFFENNLPASIITTRQNMSEKVFLKENRLKSYASFKKGAYIISAAEKDNSDIILIGSGSEVGTLLECQDELIKKNIYARVVSIPCFELFEESSQEYKNQIFDNFAKPIYLHELSSFRGFSFLLNPKLKMNTMNQFGMSAPSNKIIKELKFDKVSVTQDIIKFLNK